MYHLCTDRRGIGLAFSYVIGVNKSKTAQDI